MLTTIGIEVVAGPWPKILRVHVPAPTDVTVSVAPEKDVVTIEPSQPCARKAVKSFWLMATDSDVPTAVNDNESGVAVTGP